MAVESCALSALSAAVQMVDRVHETPTREGVKICGGLETRLNTPSQSLEVDTGKQ